MTRSLPSHGNRTTCRPPIHLDQQPWRLAPTVYGHPKYIRLTGVYREGGGLANDGNDDEDDDDDDDDDDDNDDDEDDDDNDDDDEGDEGDDSDDDEKIVRTVSQ